MAVCIKQLLTKFFEFVSYVRSHLYLVENESPATKASNNNTHCQALLVLIIK